jgi:hypothetical protein
MGIFRDPNLNMPRASRAARAASDTPNRFVRHAPWQGPGRARGMRASVHCCAAADGSFLSIRSGKQSELTISRTSYSCTGDHQRRPYMKRFALFAIAAAALVASPAFAAQDGKSHLRAQREASCKAQAAKKYSAIHFIKRHNYVKNCMGEVPTAQKKAKPVTTGAAAKQ